MFSPDKYVAALELAARKHDGQRVPGTELPYITHVVSVAAEVIAALHSTRVANPDLAVLCALLHDTIEDTGTTSEEIAALFGDEVAGGVMALSKDASLPKPEQMADSLRRIRAQPHEVWIVKLADRTINMAPPPSYWDDAKKKKYRAEAYEIADALGAASDHLHARLRARADRYARYIT